MGVPQRADRLTGVEDLVVLSPDHPGFLDTEYRQRRNFIAQLALDYAPGDLAPRVVYSQAEHAVWRAVWAQLAVEQEQHACHHYLRARDALRLDHNEIPQLADVNMRLASHTGFALLPVAGLISSRRFLGSLADGTFLSTQYIRHHSRPLYTPEPDVVHELIGHAASFGDQQLADLNRLFGAFARAAPALIQSIERLYWYTMEFGVLEEHGELKAFGAGLLSSYGELARFQTAAQLLPLDCHEATQRAYDPTAYQKVLYVVPSLDRLAAQLATWFAKTQ